MRKFLRRELDHEIHGEALEIAFDCLDERTCLDVDVAEQPPVSR